MKISLQMFVGESISNEHGHTTSTTRVVNGVTQCEVHHDGELLYAGADVGAAGEWFRKATTGALQRPITGRATRRSR